MSESLTETSVEIRTLSRDPSAELGRLATPLITPDVDSEIDFFNDTSNSCEDCPEVNDRPPDQSECPYFEHEAGRWPVCLQDDTGNDHIRRFFF